MPHGTIVSYLYLSVILPVVSLATVEHHNLFYHIYIPKRVDIFGGRLTVDVRWGQTILPWTHRLLVLSLRRSLRPYMHTVLLTVEYS
jgi:hypothetical protein